MRAYTDEQVDTVAKAIADTEGEGYWDRLMAGMAGAPDGYVYEREVEDHRVMARAALEAIEPTPTMDILEIWDAVNPAVYAHLTRTFGENSGDDWGDVPHETTEAVLSKLIDLGFIPASACE